MGNLKNKKIFIVEPHPDDAFLGMWFLGSIIKVYRESTLITLTRGETDFLSKKRDEAVAYQRKKETEEFVRRYQIKDHCQLDLCDGGISRIEAEEALLDIIGEPNENIRVFCPSMYDIHHDHKTAYVAVSKYWLHYQYCIDSPPRDIPYFSKYDLRKLETLKKKEFESIYPSQQKENHPSFLKRMRREYVSDLRKGRARWMG